MGTLEYCKQLETEVTKKIRDVVMLEYQKKVGTPTFNWPNILDELKSILTLISSVESKTKTYTQKNSALHKVRELITKIKETILAE